jgi:hypothetical protein
MKKSTGFLLFAAFVVLVGTSCIRYVPYDESGPYNQPTNEPYYEEPAIDQYDNLDSAYFYTELEPYGSWVSSRPYGYIWIPRNVGYGWRPYTTGHWAWTDYGWTWVSLERWGWIPFHYGRWGFDRGLGWFWVPDVVWGPAWVAWRWDDVHVGWAPLPPGADYFPGRGFGRNQWDIPGHSWNFVRGRDFMDRRVDRWVLPVERNTTIINMTRFEVNINERDRRVFDDGVDVDQVRRWTNKSVDRFTLKDSTRPGPAREEGSDLVVTKPVIRRNEAAKPKQVLDQTAAEKQLGRESSSRIYSRATRNEEEIVREEHDQERVLMKDSQQTEINEVRRRAQQDEAKIQSPAEKRKVEEQSAARVAELKKKHDQEKTELEKRQKVEEDKAKRVPVRRKTDKN